MNDSKIPVRYAKALFAYTKEEQLNESVKDDMQYLHSIFTDVPEFRLLLYDPIIKATQKKDIVHSIFKNQVERITLQFFDLIIQNKREVYLPSIARVFISLNKKDKGIKSAILITPQPIGQNLRDTIMNLVSKKLNTRIELEEKFDEKLIGGFVLRIEDQQIDASVVTHLNNIKKELLNS